jgi:hypothetical protein
MNVKIDVDKEAWSTLLFYLSRRELGKHERELFHLTRVS